MLVVAAALVRRVYKGGELAELKLQGSPDPGVADDVAAFADDPPGVFDIPLMIVREIEDEQIFEIKWFHGWPTVRAYSVQPFP